MSNRLPTYALQYLVDAQKEMSFVEQGAWTSVDAFADFAKRLVRRNRFGVRLAQLRTHIELCLARDGKQVSLQEAGAEAAKEMGLSSIGQRLQQNLRGTINSSFPPLELELEYRSLIYVVGAQAPIGAWSVLHFDLLTMYEDGEGLLTDIFPLIVSSHPEIVFDSTLTNEQLIRYQKLFRNASSYFQTRSEKVQQEINSLTADLSVEAQAASGLLQLTWRALRVGIIMYKLADKLAEAGIEAANKRQAGEAERLRAEEKKRLAREEMDRFARENFCPAPNADKWLDKLDRYKDYTRTA